MEKAYAQALWQMVLRGIAPKKAVRGLYEILQTRGRAALMPHIARAFARLAGRAERSGGIVLSVAREKDERKAKSSVKKILAEMDASSKDVRVKVDESLIGGWRLEGRERLIDASFKKYLLEMYNRSTA